MQVLLTSKWQLHTSSIPGILLTDSFLSDVCNFLSSVVAVLWTTFFFLLAVPYNVNQGWTTCWLPYNFNQCWTTCWLIYHVNQGWTTCNYPTMSINVELHVDCPIMKNQGWTTCNYPTMWSFPYNVNQCWTTCWLPIMKIKVELHVITLQCQSMLNYMLIALSWKSRLNYM